MSETTARRATGLSAMKLDELKAVASSMGLTGTGRMRKGDLLEAIRSRQPGGNATVATAVAPARATAAKTAAPVHAAPPEAAPDTSTPSTSTPEKSQSVQAVDDEAAPIGAASIDTVPTGTSAPSQPTARAPRTARRASRAAGTTVASEGSSPTVAPDTTDRHDEAGPASRGRAARNTESATSATSAGGRHGESSVETSPPTDSSARGDDAGRQNRQERQERASRAVRETAAGRAKHESAPSETRRATSSSGEDDRTESTTVSPRRERADRADQSGRAEKAARSERGRSDDQAATPDDDGQQKQGQNRQQAGQGATNHDDASGQQSRYDEDERGSRRSRNRQRSRDRKRGRTSTSGGSSEWPDSETAINDDDVLVPVGGILDVLDNYAFVRTSGYLPGPDDVYVPLGMVKKHSLRKGDAVTGVVKALRDGETPSGSVGRQKFNALVRLDSVNGAAAEETSKRVEFSSLTPLYPQERLRLETESGLLTTRIIDLIAPIGKGQRGLIVAPAKAGKTMVLQGLANAITANNPECHLMVVLVDERPEEVTEMQRAVKGEVIASTFDRPAEDHTTVAELAIERAKRLVELGHDVVVLLDSITKLGRAYNLSAPASGRALAGGVDSAALYPPKKFFGAARNIEYGGSLTIVATALVETGSKMDEVIFEEFKGTANMELYLGGDLAARRIFPAVDIAASGTRREEILLADEELKIMWKLRRTVAALDTQPALELMIERLRKTRTNYELLTQVQAG